jgi:gluconate 5-dehydrogenase
MPSDIVNALFSLSGRVAIVTGGSRGIGEAIARGFAGAGARVTAVGRSSSSPASGTGTLEYRQCDVTAAGDFTALCERVFDTNKRLDILVNAAGITRPDGEQSLADFDLTLATNLKAAYASCVAVSEFMGRSGGGSIINITSIASVLGLPGNPGYAAAKGGLKMLSKALAMDFADRNIRVNNLAPGYIRTAMTEESYADPARHEQRKRHTMLRRWGTTNDLVGAAIFLASDASSYVTGIDLFIDGGWTAKGLVER